MGITINKIIIGDYKNSKIKLIGDNGDIPVLICKGFLSKKEIPMNKTMIKNLKHTFLENREHDVIIEWKDGKLSQAIMDDEVYAAVLTKML